MPIESLSSFAISVAANIVSSLFARNCTEKDIREAFQEAIEKWCLLIGVLVWTVVVLCWGFSEAGGAVCGDGAADSAVVPVLQGRGALG